MRSSCGTKGPSRAIRSCIVPGRMIRKRPQRRHQTAHRVGPARFREQVNELEVLERRRRVDIERRHLAFREANREDEDPTRGQLPVDGD